MTTQPMTDALLGITTPGRICLFGEHQDYLGLPVIAAAISKRIQLTGHYRSDTLVNIDLPDIQKQEYFLLEERSVYRQSRDYFKSVMNVLAREKGLSFDKGIEATVQGNIPINSGTSSSSALVVTWTHFLLKLANYPINLEEIAALAYLAEVEEFGEPGGKMDHYATAVGQVMYMETVPSMHIKTFTPPLGSFVLGDSLQPKDTIGVLKHVKFGMLTALQKIKSYNPYFELHTAPLASADDYRHILTADELMLLRSNLSDRDILQPAKQLLAEPTLNHAQLGTLLNQHQQNLREAKRVSTPKIDRMIEAALAAGALGGKINGSGGGGCMFAYAPQNPEAVVEAIEQAGGKAYVIEVDDASYDFTHFST